MERPTLLKLILQWDRQTLHKLVHMSLIHIMRSANKGCFLVILSLDFYQSIQD